MNFTHKVICPACDNPEMGAWGTHSGGRFLLITKKCPTFGLVLGMFPMKSQYEYEISAQTKAELRLLREKKQELAALENKIQKLRSDIFR